MAEIVVQRSSWSQWPSLALTWERIHNMCPDASFFLSREWVDCWINTFGPDLTPDLLTFVKNGEAVGCCLLVWRTEWVKGIRMRRVYLNCAGEDETDSTCLEFNSLLTLPEYEQPVANALLSFLRTQKWDEFLLPGAVEQKAIQILADSLGAREIRRSPAHYIDFEAFRDPPADFLSGLSSKTRAHIRRTQRAYEEIGGVCNLSLAQSTTEALEMLQQLAHLHQAAWKERGHPGAFSSQRFTGFHERMIRQAFGQTLLFRVEAGAEIIGVLYCFLFRGWVYFYQSGLSYTFESRRSPGLLSLYLSICHCLGQSKLKGFDLMAGDKEYKRSLTHTHRSLQWIVVRRPTVSTFLFRGLRSLKRSYVQIRGKRGQTNQLSDRLPPTPDASQPNEMGEPMVRAGK